MKSILKTNENNTFDVPQYPVLKRLKRIHTKLGSFVVLFTLKNKGVIVQSHNKSLDRQIGQYHEDWDENQFEVLDPSMIVELSN